MFIPMRDYPHIFRLAQQCAIVSNKQGTPLIDLYKVLQNDDTHTILVASAEQYEAYESGSDKPTIRPRYARTFYLPVRDVYIIVYNHKQPFEVVRYSIAHELGHIWLGHLEGHPAGQWQQNGYRAQEQEANAFACSLLVPPVVLDYWFGHKPYSPTQAAKAFGVPFSLARQEAQYNYLYWCMKKLLCPEEISLLYQYNKTTSR